jgi:hypothetical protein
MAQRRKKDPDGKALPKGIAKRAANELLLATASGLYIPKRRR